MRTNQIAKINEVNIIALSENGSQLIPIRPICEALGIDPEGQRQRVERDPILSSVACMTKATGGDGKVYEMFSIPMKFVFGWLFTIDTNRVSKEAQPAVIQYKLECYDALFEYHAEPQVFLHEKLRARQEDYDAARAEVKELKSKISELKSLTIEDWRANKQQLDLPFEDHTDEKANDEL